MSEPVPAHARYTQPVTGWINHAPPKIAVMRKRLKQFAHERLHIGLGDLAQFVTSELGNQMILQRQPILLSR
jgi:hypothetical protein